MTKTKIEYLLHGNQYGCLRTESQIMKMMFASMNGVGVHNRYGQNDSFAAHSGCGRFIFVLFQKKRCAEDGRCIKQHSMGMVLERNNVRLLNNRRAWYVRDGALLVYQPPCRNAPDTIDGEEGLKRQEKQAAIMLTALWPLGNGPDLCRWL